MSDLREYQVEMNGLYFTLLLDEADAKRLKAKPMKRLEEKPEEPKAAKPANKAAATPENKGKE